MSMPRLPESFVPFLPERLPGLVVRPPRGGERPVAALSVTTLFDGADLVDADAALACLAGVLLLGDRFEESHAVSQDLETPEGSYWHGILHRREPDAGNAKYWMRRVGRHPIHAPLACDVAAAAANPDCSTPAAALRLGAAPLAGDATGVVVAGQWHAAGFIDRCSRASAAEEAPLVSWQGHEMRLLLEHCAALATGAARS